ncbi:MAG: ABC transporter substrate-binding protein [Hyphomicrobiales bacterium]|nr:extracellular solute-binding protein [Hyphomicrobiales bacterium]MDE2017925.1 ABC transporter substrate-binding protein [Hyphomicrobiales bacterium]
MRTTLTRRRALAGLGALATAGPALAAPAGENEAYGLSSFGDLAMPADFPHFAYVNPDAPKGGKLVQLVTTGGGNQSFNTFDTLNVFILAGAGAAGMGATFDSLMTGGADEPDAMYGLIARAVRVSADKLAYRFLLRPEARFHDGSRLTAADVAFTLNLLRDKGHPSFAEPLRQMKEAVAEDEATLRVRFDAGRTRDAHLIVAGMPVFSAAYWKGKDFSTPTLDVPLGCGAYKVAGFKPGAYVEFARVPDYWAAGLPVNVGANNFDRVRYEYFRESALSFEAFKAGEIDFFQENASRRWATGYDFPAVKSGRVKRASIPMGAPPPIQGWYWNSRRAKFADPRVREALGLCFDFEWTNKFVMYSSYSRLVSYFQNTDMQAKGSPGAAELTLLDPWRGKVPEEVFGGPYVPPASDGSGGDRKLLGKAFALLTAAGCKRDGDRLLAPDGSPFAIEFLDSSTLLQPHTAPFEANLKRLGIAATSRIVDDAQYKRRLDDYDFDVTVQALNGSLTPGDDLVLLYGSKFAKAPGSRNLAGIAEPAVDDMLARISHAATRGDLTTAARCLDRLLRAGRWWTPMWFRADQWYAFLDEFGMPDRRPRYDTGAPGTWWVDPAKAKALGL